MTNNEAFCGKVPLHQTNLIQPHGVLLITDETLLILQVSENAPDMLSIQTKEIVNRNLAEFLPPEMMESLAALVSKSSLVATPVRLSFPGGNFDGEIRRSGEFILFELERSTPGDSNEIALLQQMVSGMIMEINEAGSVTECCGRIATVIRANSGFDKVMVYRFDQEWNGDVVAEDMAPGMESYLGHKFPASDIPPQARALYQNTVYRLIPDISYVPVALYPVLNPLTGKFTDLSASNLRSVAAVHLEYLANMNIVASMSTRILHNGKLWGLIACHHKTPRYLTSIEKAFFSIASEFISSRIAHLEDNSLLLQKESSLENLEILMKEVYHTGQLPKQPALILAALSATGASILINGRVKHTYGSVPSNADAEELLLWMQAKGKDQDFSLPSVRDILKTNFSGVLVLPFNMKNGDVIFAYRPEETREVLWGGNPEAALHFEKNGKDYHPRTSFKTWKQSVKGTAINWTDRERLSAGRMRDALRPFIIK